MRNIATGETGWFSSSGLVDLNGDGRLNVISTRQEAFTPSDLTYIRLLGSVLSVVWSLMEGQEGDHDDPVE